jgi:hypothetical protein
MWTMELAVEQQSCIIVLYMEDQGWLGNWLDWGQISILTRWHRCTTPWLRTPRLIMRQNIIIEMSNILPETDTCRGNWLRLYRMEWQLGLEKRIFEHVEEMKKDLIDCLLNFQLPAAINPRSARTFSKHGFAQMEHICAFPDMYFNQEIVFCYDFYEKAVSNTVKQNEISAIIYLPCYIVYCRIILHKQ